MTHSDTGGAYPRFLSTKKMSCGVGDGGMDRMEMKPIYTPWWREMGWNKGSYKTRARS